MVTLPINELTCFYVAMIAFVVIGFRRGWKRELVTLVFVLLGAFFVQPNSSKSFAAFISHFSDGVSYIFTGKIATTTSTSPLLSGPFDPWGPLLIFVGIVALGYFVGSRAFPKPSTPNERFIGIVPAVVYGAVILSYLGTYLKSSQGNSNVSIAVSSPDPANYIPIIFVIVIVAVIAGMVISRAKKSPPAKK